MPFMSLIHHLMYILESQHSKQPSWIFSLIQALKISAVAKKWLIFSPIINTQSATVCRIFDTTQVIGLYSSSLESSQIW